MVTFQNYYLNVYFSTESGIEDLTDSHSQLLRNLLYNHQWIVIWDCELEGPGKEGNYGLDTSSAGHFTYVVSSAAGNTVIGLSLFPLYRGGEYGWQQLQN